MSSPQISPHKIDKRFFSGLFTMPRSVLLDIGCYDGRDSFEFLELFDNTFVYAADADPRSEELFRRVLQNKLPSIHSRISFSQIAIGKEKGISDWFGSESSIRRHHSFQTTYPAASSLKRPQYQMVIAPDLSYSQSKVPVLSLNEWVEQIYPNGRVDLAWVDVNGAEEDFIDGGLRTLQQRVKYLHIEFSDKVLFENQITKEEILSRLQCFELLGIYDFLGNYGNLLLKNKDLP